MLGRMGAVGAETVIATRVVGVGASAGGLEALDRFFGAVPPDSPFAFIVVQHLSPDHKSLMADILGKRTRLPVAEAHDGQQILPSHVYLVPPRSNLYVEDERIRFRDRAAAHTLNLPVDILFRSLAEQYGDNAIGIVLSGTGSDGRVGIESIKSAGGFVLVQDPATARFDGMPLSAVATGLVDAILAPEEMPGELRRRLKSGNAAQGLAIADAAEALDLIHGALAVASGIDFSEYKPSTVLRRIERRMAIFGLENVEEYARRLELDASEAKLLAQDLLISVTRFFRDEESFEVLANAVFPDLVASAHKGEPLRLWIPGCATGQEAYSFAMVLTETIERAGAQVDFKLFATDVDRDALQFAAEGAYRASQVAEVSPERLERFFALHGEAYVVDRSLRRNIVFAPHNIARDPPFTRLDIISCRNLLIYLNASLQKRVLSSLAFALKPEGHLVVGASESLGDVADMFRVVDSRWKIFRRVPGIQPAAPHRPASIAGLSPREPAVRAPSERQQAIEVAFRLLVDKVAPASVLVTDSLDLVSVFGNASEILRIPLGEATQRIVDLLPPELQNPVAMACHRALSTREPTSLSVTGQVGNVTSVRVMPFELHAGQRYLVIVFERSVAAILIPNLAPHEVSEEAQRLIAELQREVSFVRESLQATIEELETSNEELQATNEELLASNEELQSTNEELQSVNEELGAVNVEFQAKITELVELTTDLDYLFKASPVGTLFLDDKLFIRRFSPEITMLFNVIERDIGRPIQHLSQKFDDREFLIDAERVLATGKGIERDLAGTGDRKFVMRLGPYRTPENQIRGVVADFVDVTLRREAEESARRVQRVLDSLQEEVVVLDQNARITMVNAAWCHFWEDNDGDPKARAALGTNYLEVCDPSLRAGLEDVLARRRASFTWEYPCHAADKKRWFVLYASPLADDVGAVVSHIDITARKLLEGGAE
jgi:two-component system CheB/CheR fusion protein